MTNRVQHQYPRKDIIVSIYQYQLVDGEQRPVCINVTSTFGTTAHAPDHVAQVMRLVTGFNLESDDWDMLNALNSNDNPPGFKFGRNWEFYVEAHLENKE